MIAIIDYDAGNLKSVEKALVSLGEEVLVSRDSSTKRIYKPININKIRSRII
jgi:imidazoleglycerol phosphate synthase glutamine amidotransferase subunit HisH